jgi:hypothetical protein
MNGGRILVYEQRQAGATSSDRTTASCRRHHPKLALAIGREREASPYILHSQIGEVREQFLHSHAGSKILQDVSDCNPQAADARLTAALGSIVINRW